MTTTQAHERRTMQHLLLFIRRGNVVEIAKVLRRRVIHGLRLAAKTYFHAFGFYYYSPRVQAWRGHQRLMRLLARTLDYRETPADAAKPYRIALILRDGEVYPKSSAFIRLVLPLTHPSLRHLVSLRFYAENTAAVAEDMTACIVQRTAFDTVVQAAQLVDQLRALDIPLIVDTDDAFHDIDPKHPEYELHKQRLEAFNYLVAAADQLWLSTDTLARKLRPEKAKIAVIPNSLDQRLWRRSRQHATISGPLRLLYMGTVSHDADFKLILPALAALATVQPGAFELTIIGVAGDLPEYPWLRRKYQKTGGSIYPRFIPWLCRQGPFDIGLAPLVDTAFNAGKSDIKCLDYLALGILPIVSRSPAYETPGLDPFIIRVSNATSAWQEAIAACIRDPQRFRARRSNVAAKARHYIWQERSSGATAKQLLQLLGEAQSLRHAAG